MENQQEFTLREPAGEAIVRGITYDLTRDRVSGALFAKSRATLEEKLIVKDARYGEATDYAIRSRIARLFGDGRSWYKV